MFEYKTWRSVYESMTRRDAEGRAAKPQGRRQFVNKVRNLLGLCNKDGKDYKDKNGNRCVNLQEAKATAEEFNMQELALATIGADYIHYLNPKNRDSLRGLSAHQMLCELQYPGDSVALLEATGAGVDPSAFADISAWATLSGGLLERKILEQFQNPMFIGDELVPTENTRINEGQKIIGVSRALPLTASGGKATGERLPGEAHPRTTILERYVTLGKGREFANSIMITKEAAFFDLTGQLLPSAGAIGEWLGYEAEIQKIDIFIGVAAFHSSSVGIYPFTYDGVKTNCYQTTNANGLGYISQIAANGPLLDNTNLQTSWLQYLRNVDPETKTRINALPNRVVVNPAHLADAGLVIDPLGIERRQGTSGNTQSTSTTLYITDGPNPAKMFGTGGGRILWSPLLEQRCTDTDGLNLSQSDADKLWFHFAAGKPFKWMQLMPMTVQQAPPTNLDMLDRGLILGVFADWRALPAIVSPWHVMKNTV